MRIVEILGAGPRVVLVHGFTQTSASWSNIAERLAADGFEVVAVDAPGHGISADIHVTLADGATLLRDVAGEAVYVGYSMGARFCLHLGLTHPRAVRALVLLGVSPGIVDSAERDARRHADETLADTIETDGVDAFLHRWLAAPMFAGLPANAPGNDTRRSNSAVGLASSLRLAGTGTQSPLWGRLAELADIPTLLLAGDRDQKFSDIGRRMSLAIPARFETVATAGHAAHLENPDGFYAVVSRFLRQHNQSVHDG